MAERVEDQRSQLESACAESNLIGVKAEFLQDLIYLEELIQAFPLEEFGVQSRPLNEICDHALDPSVTFVQFEPDPIELEVEETKDVKAVIKCSNGTCEGDLTWTVTPIPPEGPIAEVMETFVDAMGFEHADVTGIRNGTTKLSAFVESFVTPGEPWVFGQVDTIVGVKPIVDLVFVLNNMQDMAFFLGLEDNAFGPGLRQHSADIVDALHEHFDARSRVAVVTVNRPADFPGVVQDTNPLQSCNFEEIFTAAGGFLAPAAAVTTHAPFRSLSSDLSDILSDLKVTCISWYGAPGAFVYSGIIESLDGSALGDLREEVDRRPVRPIIVLITRNRPIGQAFVCADPPHSNFNPPVDPEETTGYTRDTVVQAALARDAEIHIFFTGQEREASGVESTLVWGPAHFCADGSCQPLFCGPCEPHLHGSCGYEGGSGVYSEIAERTGGTYIETEISGLYHGESLYLGIIDAMSEMARFRPVGSP